MASRACRSTGRKWVRVRINHKYEKGAGSGDEDDETLEKKNRIADRNIVRE